MLTSTSIWQLKTALMAPLCPPARAFFIVGTPSGIYFTKMNLGRREMVLPRSSTPTTKDQKLLFSPCLKTARKTDHCNTFESSPRNFAFRQTCDKFRHSSRAFRFELYAIQPIGSNQTLKSLWFIWISYN